MSGSNIAKRFLGWSRRWMVCDVCIYSECYHLLSTVTSNIISTSLILEVNRPDPKE